jgi:hypothetical protein
MVQFEELQSLWQQSPAPCAIPEALTHDFRGYGRTQKIINIVKLVLVASLLGSGLLYVRHSPWTLAGVALIAAGAARLMAIDWHNQRELARIDFSEPSVDFVRHAISRLKTQRDPFRRQYRAFLLLIAVGMNAIYAGILRGPLPSRLIWHAAALLLPVAGYRLGMWVRRNRFDHECRPLIERLETLQAALENSNR